MFSNFLHPDLNIWQHNYGNGCWIVNGDLDSWQKIW